MIQSPLDDTRALRDAFGKFATGVTLVTTGSVEGPVSMTANSFTSVSLNPPLVLWCPAKGSRRYDIFARADDFAIHILSENQADLSRACAKDAYHLRHVDHAVNAENAPLIDGCLARFECRTHAIHDAGDHAIIIGQVYRFTTGAGRGLSFFSGQYGGIGQT